MPRLINGPEGPINFPDNMDDAAIETAMQKLYPPQSFHATPTPGASISPVPSPGLFGGTLRNVGAAVFGGSREGSTPIGQMFGFHHGGPAQPEQPPTSNPMLRPEAFTRESDPVLNTAAKFAGGLTTPENLGIMATTEGLGLFGEAAKPVLSRFVSLGFSYQMLHSAAQQYPEFRKAINRGDWDTAKRLGTEMGLSTIMAAVGVKHAGTFEEPGVLHPDKSTTALLGERLRLRALGVSPDSVAIRNKNQTPPPRPTPTEPIPAAETSPAPARPLELQAQPTQQDLPFPARTVTEPPPAPKSPQEAPPQAGVASSPPAAPTVAPEAAKRQQTASSAPAKPPKPPAPAPTSRLEDDVAKYETHIAKNYGGDTLNILQTHAAGQGIVGEEYRRMLLRYIAEKQGPPTSPAPVKTDVAPQAKYDLTEKLPDKPIPLPKETTPEEIKAVNGLTKNHLREGLAGAPPDEAMVAKRLLEQHAEMEKAGQTTPPSKGGPSSAPVDFSTATFPTREAAMQAAENSGLKPGEYIPMSKTDIQGRETFKVIQPGKSPSRPSPIPSKPPAPIQAPGAEPPKSVQVAGRSIPEKAIDEIRATIEAGEAASGHEAPAPKAAPVAKPLEAARTPEAPGEPLPRTPRTQVTQEQRIKDTEQIVQSVREARSTLGHSFDESMRMQKLAFQQYNDLLAKGHPRALEATLSNIEAQVLQAQRNREFLAPGEAPSGARAGEVAPPAKDTTSTPAVDKAALKSELGDFFDGKKKYEDLSTGAKDFINKQSGFLKFDGLFPMREGKAAQARNDRGARLLARIRATRAALPQQNPDEMGFKSKLLDAALDKLPPKAPRDQVLNTLINAGVTPDEMKWSGTDDFLRDKKVVSKQELLQHITENRVTLRETVKGGARSDPETQQLQRQLAELNIRFDDLTREHDRAVDAFPYEVREALNRDEEFFDQATIDHIHSVRASLSPDHRAAAENIERLLRQIEAVNDQRAHLQRQIFPSNQEPQYEQWTLPGGTNYREVLIQAPHKGPQTAFDGIDAWEARELAEREGITTPQVTYTGPHFSEPNIVAHLRLKDRTTTTGKKILFMEELQSDWHEEGSRLGYNDPEAIKRAEEVLQSKKEGIAQAHAVVGQAMMDLGLLTPEQYQTYNPDDTYLYSRANQALNKLASDRMEKSETKDEWDHWTHAYETLDSAIDEYSQASDEWNTALIAKEKLQGGPPPGPFSSSWHELGLKRALRMAAEGGYDGIGWTTGDQQVERYYGKDAPPEKGAALRRLYDEMIPGFAKKYASKWGAKVGSTKILSMDSGSPDTFASLDRRELAEKGEVGGASKTVWHLPVTPEMRDSVRNGQYIMGRPGEKGVFSLAPYTGRLPSLAQGFLDWLNGKVTQRDIGRGIARRIMAEQDLLNKQRVHQLNSAIERMDSFTAADFRRWMDGAERKPGSTPLSPEDQSIADQLGGMLDAGRDKIWSYNPDLLPHFIDNYFSRVWEKPGRTTEMFRRLMTGRRPLSGAKGFLKSRSFDWASDAMDAGMTPITNNPVRMQLYTLHQMDKFLTAQAWKDELSDRGLIKFHTSRADVPQDWDPINDGLFKPVYKIKGAEGNTLPGFHQMGQYYAPREIAKDLNNYLGPGLAGNPKYDAIRYIGNAVNQANLGLSAYHGLFSAITSAASDVGLGVQKVTRGQAGAGIKDIVRGYSGPLGTASNLWYGHTLRAAAIDPNSASPALRRLAQLGKGAGMRYNMGAEYSNEAIQGFWRAWSDKDVFPLLRRSVPALMQYIGKPVMEHMVPNIKWAAFARQAEFEMGEMTKRGASQDEITLKLNQIADSMDSRFGQVTYDNRFWNKTAKDVAMLSIRAVGWNWGSFKEIGGGLAVDTPREALKTLTLQGRPELTQRMAFTVGLVGVGAFYGALYQYLATGKPPEKLEDYIYPQTGQFGPDGRPLRISIASYLKDMAGFSHAPGSTVTNKLHPIIQEVYDLWRNADYYNTEIRHPDDPVSAQAGQVARYLGKSTLPFSVQNAWNELQNGANMRTAFQSAVGITPAPSWVGKSKFEQSVQDFSLRHREAGPRTEQNAEHSHLVSMLRTRVERGLAKPEEVQSAFKSGQISANDIDSIYEGMSTPTLDREFKGLRPEEAVQALRYASADERVKMKPYIADMIDRVYAGGYSPDDAKRISSQLVKALQ